MNSGFRIEKVSRDKLPAGTKVLTEDEVFNHYVGLIQDWKPESDVWPFKYGWMALGAASCTTNYLILRQYRRRLKLNYGILAVMTVGCAVIPSVLAPIAHVLTVTKKIFLQENCLTCLQIRAVGFQLVSALGYALTVNPMLCFMKAQHLATYNVPGYYTAEQRRKTWELYKKFTRRISGPIYVHMLLNSAIASAITANEAKYFLKLQDKIVEKNKELADLKAKLPK